MPDLRYHVISLISVFLALAIGILLGVAMADRGVVSDRLEAQITDVRRRFDEQQKEIANLREEAASGEDLLAGMSETLVTGRLIGVEIAIVSGPYADADTVESVRETLTTAGANITSVQSLEPPSTPSEVTSPETTTPLQGDYARAALSVLGETGGFSSPPQAVVFVGGGEIPDEAPSGTLQALNEAEADLFEVWLDAGARVVAAEPTEAGRSEIELFQSAGAPSVDNADTPAGGAAIVQVLASPDDDGSYGTKSTASDAFPPPVE